ncbi:Ig-like domain-containing protein [Moraxella cuniculi]|uniref:UBX domain n=1 Tax=Moraxella cuniculi TaxID=34061 RepID=A0A3S4R6R0_9GAMM|nr:Ig-like domain-containing protein [Moraxella cuniculi]VEG14016.1 UBX domain [Moraxella cuniculi]
MKNIIVKINDAVQTVQEVNVVTNDGQPTVIKATKNVNYQFIDRATGRGPDHIVTKRVGQDLHISLEDEGKESDLIIEGFYDQDGAAALIGQAENGQYYYYVPDTGEVADYVTQLVPGDIEGQALGGESVVAPWWLGATQTKAAIWPWLLGGLLGAGAIAALANDDDDKGSNDNNSTTPVQPTPKTATPTVTVTNKDTDNDGVDDKTTISGTTEPNAEVTVKLPDGSTVTTKANDKGEYSVDVPVLNEGDKVEVTAKAPNKETSDPTEGTVPAVDTTPNEPEVEKTATPTVNVTNKDTDNDGVDDKTTISGTTEPNAEVTVKLPDGSTVTTKANDKGEYSVDVPVLNEGDKVEVTAKAPNKETSDPTEGTVPAVDTTPNEPEVEKTATPTVNVTNKDTDNDGVDDKTTISGTTEPNAEVTVKLPDGSTVTTKANDKGEYSVDVPVLNEGDKVEVTAKAPNKETSDPTEGTVPAVDTTPNEPEVEKTATPTVNVTNKDTDNDGVDDKTTISGTTEPNAEVTVKLPDGSTVTTKANDKGEYSVDVPVLNEGDKVEVTAKAPNKETSDPTEGTVPAVDTTPNEPEVEKTATPTVNVTNKDTDNDGVDDKTTISGTTEPNAEVTVKLPDGSTVTTKANDKGEYSVDVPVLNEGDKVEVTAKAPNKETSDPTEGTVPAVDTTPNEPEVEKTATPTVNVTNKDTDNDGVDDKTTISGTTEPNAEVTVKLPDGSTVTTKANDKGEYSVDVPVLNEGDKVEVTAKAPNKETSDPTEGTVPAVDNTPTPAAVDNSNGDGVVTQNADEGKDVVTTVKLNNNNGVDNLTIDVAGGTSGRPIQMDDLAPVAERTFTAYDKDGNEVTDGVTANQDGTVNVAAGVVKFDIKQKALEDNETEGTELLVYTVGGVQGNEAQIIDTSFTPVASEPTVTPSTKDGSVTVNPGTDNDEVPITFTGEDNQPKKVTAKKDTQTNTWTLDDPNGTGATINSQTGEVTIPQDSVKDGEKVTAIGKETGKNDSEPVDDNAGTDTKNATVDNTNKDGVVTQNADEGKDVVTTVKLTNNNGVDNLAINVAGTGTKPADPATDLAAITTRTFTAYDAAGNEVTNGVTANQDGSVNVKAGVVKFDIKQQAVADSTTEGAETLTYTVGGVTGNEATINDTSTAPKTAGVEELYLQEWLEEGDETTKTVDVGTIVLTNDTGADDIPFSFTGTAKAGKEGATTADTDFTVYDLIARDADTNEVPGGITYTVNADGSGTFSVAPGVKYVGVRLNIIQDNTREPDEPFTMKVGKTGNELTADSKVRDNSSIIQLTIALENDSVGAGTSGTNTDKVTNDSTVIVTGVPAGRAWEYTTDGGATWNNGSGDRFEMPNNTELQGVKHVMQVRLKDDTSTTSNELTAVYDKTTTEGRMTVEIVNGKATIKVVDLEPNSVVNVNGTNKAATKEGVVVVDNITVNPSSVFGAKRAIEQTVSAVIKVTDIAGNTAGSDTAQSFRFMNQPNIYNERASEADRQSNVNNNVTNSNDVIFVGSDGGYGDIGGNILGPVNISTLGGNDTLIGDTIQAAGAGSPTTIDMGAGNDSIYLANYIAATGMVPITINMGDGDDLIDVGTASTGQSFYSPSGAAPINIDMGNGNDTFILSGWKGGAGPVSITGGAGFDTIVFDKKGSKDQPLGFNDSDIKVTGFERILLDTDDVLDLAVGQLTNNGNGTKVINGVSYTGLFIEKLDGSTQVGQVNLGTDNGNGTTPGFTKQANAPEGYNAYLADNGQMVYIQDVITIL